MSDSSKLRRRLVGSYRASYRNKHLELRGLKDSEFRLLELYIDAAIWDESKPNLGKVEFTDMEVAGGLGWSESKVSRSRNGLVEKGHLIMEGRKKVIPNFTRYIPKRAADELAKMKDRRADLHEGHADLQVSRDSAPSNPPPISRYKDSFKDKFNKEDWKDCLVDREMAKEPCFCRSGKSLEGCCGPSVHESLKSSEEIVELCRRKEV